LIHVKAHSWNFGKAGVMHRTAILIALVSIALPSRGLAGDSQIEQGRILVQANCARCHNLEKTGDSPSPPAPPFRVISKMYKASDIEEALVEGIVVGHPAMPEFEMTGEQAAAVAAFIDSLAN
jgi:cytochrome c